MENLIIYGGSFDPIHNGHMRIARAASLFLNADVVFVPSRAPRWKKPVASPKQRLEMLNLALKTDGSSAFSVDLFEMNNKEETNYMIDTVRYFARIYPNHHLFILIGADEVNAFPEWKNPEEICKLATPLYVPRSGIALDDKILSQYNMRRLAYDKSGFVSSSAIRALESVDVPISVRDYIEKNRLYYMEKIQAEEKPNRLEHSVSVANLAYFIAQRNRCEDYQKAYIAGLLHDLGKETPDAEAKAIIDKHFPDFSNVPAWCRHQFVGAYKARTEFGITDPTILDAIEFHATGKPHMTPIGKIIYSSDKIEPTRGFDSQDLINECLKNYYVGFLAVLAANRQYLEGQGYSLSNPLTSACMDLYLGDHGND
jgi:nicotinate-nucleotide adenylyltransferase